MLIALAPLTAPVPHPSVGHEVAERVRLPLPEVDGVDRAVEPVGSSTEAVVVTAGLLPPGMAPSAVRFVPAGLECPAQAAHRSAAVAASQNIGRGNFMRISTLPLGPVPNLNRPRLAPGPGR